MSPSGQAVPERGAKVTLREVTRDTVREICNLRVGPEQQGFVAPNAISIAQAYFDRERAWFRAVFADETPVGFVMLSDDPKKPEYYLWRFMIDARYQRTPPANGLILKVYTRSLDRDKEGNYSDADCKRGDAAARDHMWLTEADAKELVRANAKKGDT